MSEEDSKFVIVTDYGSDMPEEFFAEHGIDRIPMPYTVDGVEYAGESSLSAAEFYGRIRQGATPHSAQVSLFDADIIFRRHLDAGEDIIYVGFSSGISGSFETMYGLAERLAEEYPQRRIKAIDTLSACGSQGVLTYVAAKAKKEGRTFDEVAEAVESNVMKTHTLFLVDDLTLIRKGGRISRIEALMGTMLGIKPVLKLNDHGRIAQLDMSFGRKKSLKNIVEQFKKVVIIEENDFINVGHCDCRDEAEKVAANICEVFPGMDIVFTDVNALVGSHVGPGGIGIFCIGVSREAKTITEKISSLVGKDKKKKSE